MLLSRHPANEINELKCIALCICLEQVASLGHSVLTEIGPIYQT